MRLTEKAMFQMGGLVVTVYLIYMACHTIAGGVPPDGLLLSTIVGTLAVFAGINLERRFPEQ